MDKNTRLPIDAPFLPDRDYIGVLNEGKSRLYSLHFSLYSRHGADARHCFDTLPVETLAQNLKMVQGPDKYVLLNSRFLSPAAYFNRDFLTSLVEDLECLLEARVIDGIVFSDAYLLQALSEAGREAASRLEAVPSVNFMPDSFDKVQAVMELISRTHFLPPGKLVLDRSLNRRPDDLVSTVDRCRSAFSGIKLGLLANEGCLYQCPFKPAHDAHIALANQTGGPALTFQTNHELGCRRVMGEEPWRLLASPFIRPEDMDYYRDTVDFIKICGRTLGPDWLSSTFRAYVAGFYDGNLLALMDTMEWMADLIDIPNPRIPSDFIQRVASCDKQCRPCGFCRSLYDRLVRRAAAHIRDLRAPGDQGGLQRRSFKKNLDRLR